ncbi:MAG: riboflavin synthase [Verrucomicrobiales bacterium]|jgi:riboflavin synthase|tara:strand:+ start:3009 stop:3608 length:600 start_codon:yes stop_codon:yes gene_type:complete
MFTGLVESNGIITGFDQNEIGATLQVDIPFKDQISMGESIAVNGCCLTVSGLTPEGASFNLLKETLNVTALINLKKGKTVNLERAIAAGQRFGGHFVTGHVDSVSEIINYEKIGDDHRLDIKIPSDKNHLLVHKGSISIDGISLTVAEIDEDNLILTCWITPHTHSNTNLIHATNGDLVNLEFDLIAKHLERIALLKSS